VLVPRTIVLSTCSMTETTRDRIVCAADELFYRRGFENTSFADIADAVEISRGNFYHHFKSKDEILDAVIAARVTDTREMIARWESATSSPRERIATFIDILIRHRALIVRYGCPVGTLCTELAKLEHTARSDANALFGLFRAWLERQFALLGTAQDPRLLAMQLLARTQGVAVLANAFDDERFIRREVKDMHTWLDQRIGGASSS
jgi:TetR/AcrR family transcriptional regulator, transcriptional repressor for nem operon